MCCNDKHSNGRWLDGGAVVGLLRCEGGVGWLQWWCLDAVVVFGIGEMQWSWRYTKKKNGCIK